MRESKNIELVKVTIILRDKCYLGEDKWKCTISGKEKISRSPRISYIITDFEEALESFEADEVDAVNIFRGNMNPF